MPYNAQKRQNFKISNAHLMWVFGRYGRKSAETILIRSAQSQSPARIFYLAQTEKLTILSKK